MMLKSLFYAFSVYSAIPVPVSGWSKEQQRTAVCYFPLVGLVIGILEYLLFLLCLRAGFGAVLRGALLTVCPLLLTGGIHMDGFLDVSDALHSWRDREEKIRIMKDPHIGAFAVISAAVYLIVMLGLNTEISEEGMRLYAAGFVISRCVSGIALLKLPKMEKSVMLKESADETDPVCAKVLFGELIAAEAYVWAVGLYSNQLLTAVLMLPGVILPLGLYVRTALKQFGGVSGDLAGWFLQIAELMMLACVVMAETL